MAEMRWQSVLRGIEREFDGLPPEPTPAQKQARRLSERRTLEKTLQRRERRNHILGAFSRFGLTVALSVAILFWPYGHACGFGLFSYVSAATAIIVGAVWSITWTWENRMPRAHAAAMVMALWGLVLITAQVLPRVGYAKVDPVTPAHWWCGN